MPINKRESLLFTFIMCFCMVLWMSIYNVALQHGAINGEVVAAAWLGFPVAYIFAMCCDWFVASPVSYTHLDVYKRQRHHRSRRG